MSSQNEVNQELKNNGPIRSGRYAPFVYSWYFLCDLFGTFYLSVYPHNEYYLFAITFYFIAFVVHYNDYARYD